MASPNGSYQHGQQSAYYPYNPNTGSYSTSGREPAPSNAQQANSAQPFQPTSQLNGYGSPTQAPPPNSAQTAPYWQQVPRPWTSESQQARDVVDRFGGPEAMQRNDREEQRRNAEYYRQQFQQAQAEPRPQPQGPLTQDALRAQGNRMGRDRSGGMGRWWNEQQGEMVWDGVGWVRRNRSEGQ